MTTNGYIVFFSLIIIAISLAFMVVRLLRTPATRKQKDATLWAASKRVWSRDWD